jgi:phosphate transport system protein
MIENPRATYDKEYNEVVDAIIKLGEMVDTAIRDSVESLKQRDQHLAQQVIENDEKVNDLRFKIEEDCFVLLVTQQPAATDMRAVISAMNIVVDIERMGDHAAGIAKTVIRMGDEPLLKPLIDIPKMTEVAREMLHEALEAFIDRDAERAHKAAERDDEVDYLYRAVFDELVEIMSHKPDAVERATYLLWCAHNLERIGDRATNIAERVVFITTGDMEELNI